MWFKFRFRDSVHWVGPVRCSARFNDACCLFYIAQCPQLVEAPLTPLNISWHLLTSHPSYSSYRVVHEVQQHSSTWACDWIKLQHGHAPFLCGRIVGCFKIPSNLAAAHQVQGLILAIVLAAPIATVLGSYSKLLCWLLGQICVWHVFQCMICSHRFSCAR